MKKKDLRVAANLFKFFLFNIVSVVVAGGRNNARARRANSLTVFLLKKEAKTFVKKL